MTDNPGKKPVHLLGEFRAFLGLQRMFPLLTRDAYREISGMGHPAPLCGSWGFILPRGQDRFQDCTGPGTLTKYQRIILVQKEMRW